MTNNLIRKLDLLIESDETQAGFELEKELMEAIRKTTDQREKGEYEKLLLKLKYYLLPWMSSREFEEILRTKMIPFIISGANFREKIGSRLMPYPEDSQNVMRIEYMQALLDNMEKIGSKSLSDWLLEYDKFTNNRKTTTLEKKEFISRDEAARTLQEMEKTVLLKIFDLYDFLTPDIDEASLHEITEEEYKRQAGSMQYGSPYQTQEQTSTPSEKVELSLQEALKKYPAISEQLATSRPIKIRAFPSPVRPSVKNWLSDYTYNLGYDPHSSIVRGNFMFQNENAKILSPGDRQKLSYILKAYDENTPVTVDPARKQIIFPASEIQSRPTAPVAKNISQYGISNLPHEAYSEKPAERVSFPKPLEKNPPQDLEKNYEHYQIPQRKPDFPSINHSSRLGSSEFKPQENQLPSAAKVTFGSPQKLPYEKEIEKRYSPPPAAPKPTPQPAPAPPKPVFETPAPPKSMPKAPEPQPLRISPATMLDGNGNANHAGENNNKEELPKNVVNLKEQ